MTNDNKPQSGFKVIRQYLKDLSFENPLTPANILSLNTTPQISLDIDIAMNKLDDNNLKEYEESYEIVLAIKSSAKDEQMVLFHVELQYAGIFLLANIPPEHVKPLLAIEAPHLLFPFARQILCEATQNGAFPPLLLDPVDFAGLYYSNIEQPSGNA